MGNVGTCVVRVQRLSPAEVAEVLALTRAVGAADGAYPLSEHVTLHLRHGGDLPAVHLLARQGDLLVGYAHVDTTDAVEGASAEMCVHPGYRRRGLGRALAMEALAATAERSPNGRLRLWAHGDHPGATALAESLAFVRFRVLWQMRRSLYAPLPSAPMPEGLRLRPYRQGIDDEPWLALNARAFAGHPEQGRWGLDDLRVRLGETWFDPEGFLLAEREGTLVGFHWTKVHGTPRSAGYGHDHDPIGEIYVLGVDPAEHGHGLGAALSVAGLRHLRDLGLDQVMLYVDESNHAAISLYHRLGFARWATDVGFCRAVDASLPGQSDWSGPADRVETTT